MAKLYFKYGVMGSGKTTALLQVAYDNESMDNKVVIMKPKVDTKGDNMVVSRMAELARKVDYLIDPKDQDELYNKVKAMKEQGNIDILLVDESQFLTESNVRALILIVEEFNIPVMCFGLRTTFDLKPFRGSSLLFAVADSIQEVSTKVVCKMCGKRLSTKNMRLVDGKPTFEGDTVAIDGEDVTYKSVCSRCFYSQVINY